MTAYVRRPGRLVALVCAIVIGLGTYAGVPVAAALEVGDKAPDFTLPSHTGGTVSLSQFRGKRSVLLEFYGADFVPQWAANLSARKADYSEFEALNVQLLGISANVPFSQKTFADSLKLPYPLLSDFPELKVIRSYGGVNPKWAGMIGRRAFFLIDQQGIVRGKWLPPSEEVFTSEPILKAARALRMK